MAYKDWFYQMLRWRAPHRELHGIHTWTPLMARHDQEIAFNRVADALELLKRYAPARYSRVRRCFAGILVYGTTTETAKYIVSSRICQLWESYILSPDTSNASIASVIVHEATHGWLYELGIEYSEPLRYRVEHICVRAELLFLRRVPNATVELNQRERQLLALRPDQLTDANYMARQERELRELGCPEWIISTVMWVAQRIRRITPVRADAQKAARRSTHRYTSTITRQ